MSQTLIPDQRNPATVLASVFSPHTHKGARMMLDACRAVVSVEGWDALKAIIDDLDARYTALAATPTAMGGGVPTVSNLAPAVGDTLSVLTPQYDGIPAGTVAYQWIRGASTEIGGATSRNYTAVEADEGETLKCEVTVTNSGGSLVQTSAATAAVTA